MSTFGDRLDTLCRERGIVQIDLASRLGVNRTTLFVWRTGPPPEYLAILVALADALDVSLDWLLGRSQVREVNGQAPPPCRECAELRAQLDRAMEALRRPAGNNPPRIPAPTQRERHAAEIDARAAALRELKRSRYEAGRLGAIPEGELDAVLAPVDCRRTRERLGSASPPEELPMMGIDRRSVAP